MLLDFLKRAEGMKLEKLFEEIIVKISQVS
jgi:hypothetical protein